MSQPVAEVGGYKNITATGAVSTGPCQLIGFYVNSTNGGTLVLKDGGSRRYCNERHDHACGWVSPIPC
jgi:hypothetical protein